MAEPIEFFVDDKPYSTLKGSQSVADILGIVGLSPDQFFLISEDGTKLLDPKQSSEIHSGNRFTTEKRDRESKPPFPTVVHYKINGEKQTTCDPTLSVEQILLVAGNAASIDLSQLNNYILEDIKTGKKYQNPADTVDILNDDEFLAVHSGRTPVACRSTQ